jgi:hypothetical protein
LLSIGFDMQPEPELEAPGDTEPRTPDQTGAVAGPGIRRPAAKRPTAQQLDAALLGHRQDPLNAAWRNALLLLLYQSVAQQARELIARQFGALAHREDELVLRTLVRIEGSQEAPLGDTDPLEPLLADYEFRPARRSIYSFVLQKTGNIARNMLSEAYLPDAGLWSRDLIARLKAAGPDPVTGLNSLRSGVLIEAPIHSSDEDDDAGAPVPQGLRRSETPMRHSFLRVNSLAGKLDALALDMVGKTVSMLDEQGTELRPIRLTVNHQRIWRAWLGLSHPDLIDLGEEELASALGISKATVTRDTSAAFAYMLQHPDLAALLALMEPNRFQSSAALAKAQDVKLGELEGALRGANGKRFFRKCVHQWLGEHL